MRFENVSVSRNKKEVLNGISFEIKKGKLTALLGRNGSGKSTLIGCLNGQVKYKGRILLDGIDISEMKIGRKAKEICVLPQILPDSPFTVRELVALGRKPHMGFASRLNAQDENAIASAISMTKLTGFENRPVNRLSGGERQRAFLAMAIAQDTDLIVLDEATTFMDASFEAETYDIFNSLTRENGKTVLAVMHNLTCAVNYADDIAVISDGVISAFGSAGQIRSTQIIETVFGVKKAECVIDGKEKIVYI